MKTKKKKIYIYIYLFSKYSILEWWGFILSARRATQLLLALQCKCCYTCLQCTFTVIAFLQSVIQQLDVTGLVAGWYSVPIVQQTTLRQQTTLWSVQGLLKPVKTLSILTTRSLLPQAILFSAVYCWVQLPTHKAAALPSCSYSQVLSNRPSQVSKVDGTAFSLLPQ